MTNIQKNLVAIKNLIADYEKKYGRKNNSVQLLAASKHQAIDKMREAIQGGQHSFGENYVQEALTKMQVLSDPLLEWHFIGPIQSNKTKKIAEHFSWVHSIDDEKIAKRLNDQRPSHLSPLNVCIQMNISHEKTKSGVDEDHLFSLAKYCLTLPHLYLRGLMAIPLPEKNLTAQRATFAKIRGFYEKLKASGFLLDTLSMGMSEDMEAAIAEGATIVRIGTAIFGHRENINLP